VRGRREQDSHRCRRTPGVAGRWAFEHRSQSSLFLAAPNAAPRQRLRNNTIIAVWLPGQRRSTSSSAPVAPRRPQVGLCDGKTARPNNRHAYAGGASRHAHISRRVGCHRSPPSRSRSSRRDTQTTVRSSPCMQGSSRSCRSVSRGDSFATANSG
jgi:hypothetical protein